MAKDTKEISDEAAKEGESTAEETQEYQHIDEFVKSLDSEELSYLKGCLSKMKKGDSGSGSSSEDDTLSEDDYKD